MTSLGVWTWSPDSRQLAVLVGHGIESGYVELMTVDAGTGAWRHRFNLDGRHGGGPECCVAIDWPAGSRRLVVVKAVYGNDSRIRAHRLLRLDPASGATTLGPVLAGRDQLAHSRLDSDPSGRYLLFGLQGPRSVSTWWWSGGRPVLVKRITIGSQAPAWVRGAYVSGGW